MTGRYEGPCGRERQGGSQISGQPIAYFYSYLGCTPLTVEGQPRRWGGAEAPPCGTMRP